MISISAPPRRVKRLCVAADLILAWWKGMDGTPDQVTCTGIPADARVIGVTSGREGLNVLALLVESEEFAPVEDGEPIPEFVPVFRRGSPTCGECGSRLA